MIKNELDNSCVVVKPSKYARQSSVFAIVFCFLFPLIVFFICLLEPTVLSRDEMIRMAFWSMLFLYLFLLPFAVFEFITLKRYFEFDKDGISVCFLRYKKFYPWSQFEVKQIINKRNSNMHMLWEGAMFVSTYEKYKRFVSNPMRRNLLFWKEPIFITFELDLKWWQRPRTGPIYEVNKEWFVSELEGLGIQLNESYSLFYKG